MSRVLIIFAHPALHKSRVNLHLIEAVRKLAGVTIQDLYEEYPDLHINVGREQELLRQHECVVWHHPFYWYSCPAIMKEWLDLVLEHGFAYGDKGTALRGKRAMTAITTGGPQESYHASGFNRYPIGHLLAPFEQTARLCGMEYLEPFVVHGTHQLCKNDVAAIAAEYRDRIAKLAGASIP